LEDIGGASKWFQAKRGFMSSNMKLNWTNLSPIKPWRPHGRKISVFFLKNKILSILNMNAMTLTIN
jgi:hypothetical protein